MGGHRGAGRETGRGAGRLDPRRAPGTGGRFGGVEDYSQESTGGDDFAGEFNQEDAALKVGMRVRHPTLGDGTIHKLEGSGDELRVIVLFKGKGARKLLARAAGLQPL